MDTIITKVRSYIQAIPGKSDIVHLTLSFMLGRVFLLEGISPFGMAYLCSYLTSSKKNTLKTVLTVIFAVLGTATTIYSRFFLKQLLSYVLFGLIYISVCTFSDTRKNITIYTCASSAVLISGIIYYAQLEGFWHNLIILLVEGVLCLILPVIISRGTRIITEHTDIPKHEDIMSLYALITISLAGFCGIQIGTISAARTIGAVFIMIIGFAGGTLPASACGIGIGVLYSLYGFEFNEYAGIFGFCGLITGLMQKYKRPGIILGYMLCSGLLRAYFGGWSDSVFTEFEIVISVCLFCLIPYRILVTVKGFADISIYKNFDSGRTTAIAAAKVKALSKSFESLAELTRKTLSKAPDNINDISTVYEITADKICKRCGLKFSCWGREAYDTRDCMNKLTGILNTGSYINPNDIPDLFKTRCIKHTDFVNELNKTYCRQKASLAWQEKLNESQKLLSMQLDGISEITENISESINDSIIFDKTNETKIYYMLEQQGYSCSEVTVVKTTDNRASATLRIRKSNAECTELCRQAEKTVSAVLSKPMGIEYYNCNKNKYTVKLTELEEYDVICSIKSVPKTNETLCGDSACHNKLSGGKYAVILSDGMGCGDNASRLSTAAIELMQQFLNVGFDKRTSISMIGSALMINNTESFATIDAVIIDMFTAKTEFIKAGASTTYIKTGGVIKKISSDTLPVGIIPDCDTDTHTYQAKDGDIIVLLSDGIHSASDNWIEQYLLNMHETDTDIIATLIVDEAARNKSHDDDMTAAVIKITKRK